MANFLQEKKGTLAGAGMERSHNALPSQCSLCESIGGIGTKGGKARAYVCAHTQMCGGSDLKKKKKKKKKPA